MAGRLARLRFRYRPSKPGRAVAYTIVIVGFLVWVISGADSPKVPTVTLILAMVAYFVVAFLEKFYLDDDPPPQ